ncbi:helix-turn-helix domain-containing protein [Paraburkholderia phenazinium]|uniref:Helix-turn-helix n=1 Tax=Paraburkholderia phenazinium TaxID=60549 RepID=A0A1N6KP81_9BURK|nr:helix-turn-helix transcriptional regulator [Paraburkholderia phenazinium]SIO58320.1 Helix-turn-helix [Paraburkholderia phenazinium]
MNTWNSRITEARTARRINQRELARLCGVSAPTVSDWESGRIKTLEAENMLKICTVLKVDPFWLVLGPPNGKAPIIEEKSPLSDEAVRLISWVERVDGLGGQARKLFGHIGAALQVAGSLTQAQNSIRDAEMASAEADLTSHIESTEGKERANRKHKP